MRPSHLTQLGFLLATCLLSSTTANSGKGPDECCFEYFSSPIPWRMISSYEETRPDCSKSGVIFVTTKPARICADPEVKWVKFVIERLDKRAAIKN